MVIGRKKLNQPSTICMLMCILAVSLVNPIAAMAYIGPGAGVSAIGAAIALVAGVCVAVLGFIWYPIKRILRKKNNLSNPPEE